MILSHYLISYEVVCHILFLWLINFDNIFGCISVDYKKKEVLILGNNQKNSFSENSQDKIIVIPTEKELKLIMKFREFMSKKYNWEFRKNDLEFLWVKLKEFARVMKLDTKRRRTKLEDLKYNFSNKSTISINDIELYLNNDKTENKLIGVLSTGTKSQIISKERNRFFDPDEMNHAMQSARKFHYYACKVVNVSFCGEKYLKKEKNFQDLYQFVPPAVWVKRCPRKCSCLQPNQDCLPTSTENRMEYFLTVNIKEEKSTWPVKLVDHAGCKCRDRCQNRKCIYPFEIKFIRRGVCECKCAMGLEKKCSKLSEGYGHFTVKDYECIVNGTCLTPKCRAGELSEEHLYLKRCPKVLY